ncbi:MAG: T9SS type A sorting domain-containing protein [Haliscomenobacter sp.]|nr:T9SS type A sorting domain-containing protein [Haliscomenobacter sp.]
MGDSRRRNRHHAHAHPPDQRHLHKEPQLAESQLNVFRNPAIRDLRADLELQEVSELVEFRIVDVAGRTIATQQLENIQHGTFTFDVSNLQSGTYFLHARTAEG